MATCLNSDTRADLCVCEYMCVCVSVCVCVYVYRCACILVSSFARIPAACVVFGMRMWMSGYGVHTTKQLSISHFWNIV